MAAAQEWTRLSLMFDDSSQSFFFFFFPLVYLFRKHLESVNVMAGAKRT